MPISKRGAPVRKRTVQGIINKATGGKSGGQSMRLTTPKRTVKRRSR